MKTNKLLILALPLLLAISACDNSGSTVKSSEEESISSSEVSSSESSQPEPYSWTEEPIPEKTSEELETEAWENLANFGELLKTKQYSFDVSGSTIPERGGIMGPGARIFSKGGDGSGDVVETVGYIANAYGILHICFNNDYKRMTSTNGYALKTSSLDESIAIVNSLCDDLKIDVSAWTYVGNNSGSAVFKTTSIHVKNYYALLERGDEALSSEYTTIYASISSNGEAVILRAENETGFVHSSIRIGNFGWPIGYDDYDEEDHRVQEFYRQLAYNDFASAESQFDGSYKSNFGYVDPRIVFPTGGNKYYFLDAFEEEKVNDQFTRIQVGFVATGDLTTNYGAQLVEAGWTLVEGTTYRLESATLQDHVYFQVDLDYVPAESTSRPNLYTQGIFYINCYRTNPF